MKSGNFWKSLVAVAITLGFIGLTSYAHANGYPSRTVTIVATTAAGGGGDTVIRMLANQLSRRLGKSFVVENKPGGTGLVGTSTVMNSPADGYTLLFGFSSHFMISPQLKIKQPFDPLRDFKPITIIGSFPFCLISNSAVPFNDFKGLVDLAKKSPGKLNYGTNGEGSVPHLMTEYLKKKVGIDLVHVPYKSGPFVNNAILANEVEMYFDGVGSAKQYIESGRVKPIAVTGNSRVQILPDVPTFKEYGVDGIDFKSWMGLFVREGVDEAVVDTLYSHIHDILETDPELKNYMEKIGLGMEALSPRETKKELGVEYKKWEEIIGQVGIEKQ